MSNHYATIVNKMYIFETRISRTRGGFIETVNLSSIGFVMCYHIQKTKVEKLFKKYGTQNSILQFKQRHLFTIL